MLAFLLRGCTQPLFKHTAGTGAICDLEDRHDTTGQKYRDRACRAGDSAGSRTRTPQNTAAGEGKRNGRHAGTNIRQSDEASDQRDPCHTLTVKDLEGRK